MNGPFRYFCIVCKSVWWFIEPLTVNVFKCPWCGNIVECREFKVEEAENVQQAEGSKPRVN